MSIHLRQIALVAAKLAPAVDDLSAIFGIEPCYIDPAVGQWGLENTLLPVDRKFLEVVAPVKDGTAAGRSPWLCLWPAPEAAGVPVRLR